MEKVIEEPHDVPMDLNSTVEEFRETLKLKFLNNASKPVPRLLSMLFYENIENNSTTYVLFMIEQVKTMLLLFNAKGITVKNMMEKVGFIISADNKSAKVVFETGTLHFKINFPTFGHRNIINDKIPCICVLPTLPENTNTSESQETTLNGVEDNKFKTKSVALPLLLKAAIPRQCSECSQASYNHVKCDHCFYVKPMESDEDSENSVDNKELILQDFLDDYKTDESQISLRQKQQETNSQLKFKIFETMDDLQKIRDRLLNLYKYRFQNKT